MESVVRPLNTASCSAIKDNLEARTFGQPLKYSNDINKFIWYTNLTFDFFISDFRLDFLICDDFLQFFTAQIFSYNKLSTDFAFDLSYDFSLHLDQLAFVISWPSYVGEMLSSV